MAQRPLGKHEDFFVVVTFECPGIPMSEGPASGLWDLTQFITQAPVQTDIAVPYGDTLLGTHFASGRH
jgi:hypothetical protein